MTEPIVPPEQWDTFHQAAAEDREVGPLDQPVSYTEADRSATTILLPEGAP